MHCLSQFLPCVWGQGSCLTHLKRPVIFVCFRERGYFTAVENNSCLESRHGNIWKQRGADKYTQLEIRSWPQCLPSLLLWCPVQGCRCQMLLHMQRHLCPGLLSVGLFLAHLCAGAARRSEGFLLEPLHWVCVEKLFLPKCVPSEMVMSGRIGEGS